MEGASLGGLESLSLGLTSSSSDRQLISAISQGEVITAMFGKIRALSVWLGEDV
jgi:hypothetical protein